MKVFAKKMISNGVETIEIKQDLGVEIYHKGQKYSFQVDNHGRLILASLKASQLIIRSKSSNTVQIEAE